MTEVPAPALRLDFDSEALAANWRALDRLSGRASAGAAVKANGYGLGIDRVAPVLREAGCSQFYVAHWSEVPALLAHVEPGQVSVLHGPVTAEEAAYARATGVRPVLNSLPQVSRWIAAGGGRCDLMIDTGMNRLGLSPDTLGDPSLAALQIDTVMSHLACADEDVPDNAIQLGRARSAFQAVRARRCSLANSAGIALGADYCFDLTRPGLALYGGVPRRELSGPIRQVARPRTAVMQIRDLKAGDRVGYNATFVAQHEMRAAVAAIGYADGYLRCWSGKGVLHRNNKRLPILGRVSMDMVVVDAGEVPELREGDWLDIPWFLPDAAAISGLSQYELLTVLGRRLIA